MASTSDDHFELIRGYIKSTAKIFSSFRSSGTHPPTAEIRAAIEAIHGPLDQHLQRFPDDSINCDALRAFLTSLSVAAHQLSKRPPAWNAWLIQNTPANFNELEVDELDHSDSSVEAPRKSAKVGPPTKRKRIESSPPPRPSRSSASGPSREVVATSPVPSSASTRLKSKRAATSADDMPPPPVPSKAKAKAPALNKAPTRLLVAPVVKVEKRRRPSPVAKHSSPPHAVLELSDDSDDDAPFASSSRSKSKGKNKPPGKLLPREVAAIELLNQPGSPCEDAIDLPAGFLPFTKRLNNPGNCMACSTFSFKGEFHECTFLGWGKRCGQCQTGGKARCTFELIPEELDQVLENVEPFNLSTRAHLQDLVARIQSLLQEATLFSQLADRANRRAAPLVAQLIDRAGWVQHNLPPGHTLGSRFQSANVLDAILSGDKKALVEYLDAAKLPDPAFPDIDFLNEYFSRFEDRVSQSAPPFSAVEEALERYDFVARASSAPSGPPRTSSSGQLQDADLRDPDGDHENQPDDMETDEQ
ncbi:hypothetical protein BDZ97DRAFT_1933984 [Flammula alnicola]|nr:hypothetical protein BDZ97DRAFT_1933984 [Flammula alnicola]